MAGFSGKVFISKRTTARQAARQIRACRITGKHRANGAAGISFENENDFKQKQS
jgi:hypothetical protein